MGKMLSEERRRRRRRRVRGGRVKIIVYIQVKTVIGFGSPNKADSHDAHGAPLGKEESQATRDQLGWK